jgi:uncharacterized delta-60 repeat protein
MRTSCLCFAIFIMTIGISAAPGDLDLSFGSGGIVVTSFAGEYYYDSARTVRVQPDGKIVIGGWISDTDNNGDRAFFLARYHPTGALDTSFGTNGKIIGPINTGEMVGNDIALQPDGKIIAVGYGFFPSYGFAVHRYNAKGTLDASFGAGGVVVTPVGQNAGANSVAIQADGKIVIAGGSYSAGQSYSDFTVVRLLPDGSLDTSFGGTGKVITSFGNGSYAYKVLLQPDGKIVGVGEANFAAFSSAFALARYNANGPLDSGFGVGGKSTHAVSNGRIYYGDAVLQADGKIIGSGHFASPPNNNWSTIVRCDPNGSLDASFAANGVFTAEPDLYIANGIDLQSDGKLVAFGSQGSYPNNRFAILRLNPNGAPDTSFGVNGKVFTAISSSSYAYDGAVQPDGKILALGGTSMGYTESDVAIVRYLGDASVSRPTQFDFDGDDRADVSLYRPNDSVWYLDRSSEGFAATQFGTPSDKITPADFDGDGKTDMAVYRPETGTWYWLNSSNGTLSAVQFGASGDLPTPSDYDDDGRADTSVFRPSNGTWYRLNSSTGEFFAAQFGVSEDKPTVGDFDGDGRADIAVWRPSNGAWYRLNSSNGAFVTVSFGLSDDLITPADFDGDGKTDIAVYRPSTGVWYSLNSTNGALVATQFGTAEDLPTAADYDGDGRADVSVFRPSDGVWYRLNSGNGQFFAVQFGVNGDRPTPAAFRY